MLERIELARRIKAARELRGIDQEELAALLAAEGLGRHDAGRLERGDPNLPFTPVRRYALAKALRVPEHWFTADDIDDVVGFPERRDGETSAEELLNELRAATRLAEELLGRLGRDVGMRGGQDRREKDHRAQPPLSAA